MTPPKAAYWSTCRYQEHSDIRKNLWVPATSMIADNIFFHYFCFTMTNLLASPFSVVLGHCSFFYYDLWSHNLDKWSVNVLKPGTRFDFLSFWSGCCLGRHFSWKHSWHLQTCNSCQLNLWKHNSNPLPLTFWTQHRRDRKETCNLAMPRRNTIAKQA